MTATASSTDAATASQTPGAASAESSPSSALDEDALNPMARAQHERMLRAAAVTKFPIPGTPEHERMMSAARAAQSSHEVTVTELSPVERLRQNAAAAAANVGAPPPATSNPAASTPPPRALRDIAIEQSDDDDLAGPTVSRASSPEQRSTKKARKGTKSPTPAGPRAAAVQPASAPPTDDGSEGGGEPGGDAAVPLPENLFSLPVHPAASVFPMMPDDELDKLANDIEEHGLRTPVTIAERDDGWTLLDGRNRMRACEAAGVVPTFHVYGGSDVVGFIVSQNIHRRHLDASQRAMVGAQIAQLQIAAGKERQQANLRKGRSAETTQETSSNPRGAKLSPSERAEEKTTRAKEAAAKMMNVSPASVQTATSIVNRAIPELAQAVRDGRASVASGAAVARLPEERQREIVEQIVKAPTKAAAKKVARLAAQATRPQKRGKKKPSKTSPVARVLVHLSAVSAAVDTLDVATARKLLPRVRELAKALEVRIASDEAKSRPRIAAVKRRLPAKKKNKKKNNAKK